MSDSKKDTDTLPGRQEATLAALLAHPTVKEAAQTAKVSEVTVWRYLRDKDFSARYRKARRELLEHGLMRLQHHTNDAARVLHEVATDKEASPAARVAAARAILDQSLRAVELGELEGRIEGVEARLRRLAEQQLLDETREENAA